MNIIKMGAGLYPVGYKIPKIFNPKIFSLFYHSFISRPFITISCSLLVNIRNVAFLFY